jgi:hypothetical protein
MKHLITKAILLAIFLLLPNQGMGFPNLPLVDPPLANKIGWNLNSNGLLYVSFDLDHNGRADYHTVHFVIKTYLASEPLSQLPDFYHGAPVFYVNYGPANKIYVISKKALFYAFDVNEDGTWDLMYRDMNEDGVNGNETYYDSPSNMFSVPSQYSENLN